MEQITVVIGDRLGKGQKVAAGAEKAGARSGRPWRCCRYETWRHDESGKRLFRHLLLR